MLYITFLREMVYLQKSRIFIRFACKDTFLTLDQIERELIFALRIDTSGGGVNFGALFH